jgi:uncharacterized membrane protein YphA (DoxX/SURF4 family)
MWHEILSIALALLFLLTGAGKVLGLAFANQNRDRLGVHPTFWRVTGLLEWAGAVGLVGGIWWWPLGFAAACGLAVLMLGAIVSRVRAHRVKPTAGRTFALTVTGDAVVFVLAVVTAVLIARGL